MTADRKFTPGAWRVVALLFFVAMFDYLDRLVLTTMRLSVKDAIPMTEAQFGLLTAGFLVVYALLAPFWGFVADRFNCSRVIFLSLLAWSVVTWLTTYATTYPELLASRVLLGVSQACYIPAAGALIGKYHRDRSLSLANGIHLDGLYVGSSLCGFGGWLAERHDWTFPLRWFGLAGVAYSILLMVVLRDPPAGENGPVVAGTRGSESEAAIGLGPTLFGLLRSGKFLLALVFYALLGITGWAYIGWMPTYLGERFHLAQGSSGLVATSCINIGSFAGMVAGGAWADRWRRSSPAGRNWVGIVGLCVCVPSALLVSHTGGLGLAMAGLLIIGLTRALADTNMIPILFQIVDRRHRATALGLLYGFATVVGGATIYLGGALRDARVSINAVFLGGAASMCVAAVLLWIIRPRATGEN